MSTLLAVFETSGIIDTIFSVIGTLLYPLFSIIFVLIGGIQHVFSAFAGIDKMSYDGQIIGSGNSVSSNPDVKIPAFIEDDGGIVYFLMHHDIVKNLIWSIVLLALFLIIIFTVMAFIKNVYSAKPKGWKEIIGNAIKGLANFIFLPICCLLGVWLGNILLQAINGATSYKGATSMERKLFIACSYNANLFRCDKTPNITWGELRALANNTMIGDSSTTFAKYHDLKLTGNDEDLVITAESTDGDRRYYAELVDQIFSETNVNLNAWGTGTKIYVTDTGTGQVGSFSYLGVANFYSLWQVNYLVLIVGGIFMLYVLGSLSFAMVRRLFLILTLFVVSPAVCALYPLDEGKAVGSWKSKFIEQVLSAYGAVAGLNIFFSLVPLIDKISIFPGTSWWTSGWGINDIVQIFILVVGLMVVKEFISLISSFVGGEDAYSKGSGLMKSAAKEVGGRAGKAISGTVGAFGKASAFRKASGGAKGSFMASLLSSAGKGIVAGGKNITKTLTGGALDFDAIDKSWKEGKEGGKKEVEDKALANAVKHISDQIKQTQERHDAGTLSDDDYNKEVSKLLKQAKVAGVEGKIANILAADLNADEMARTNFGKNEIPIKYTGEGILADIKAQNEAKEAIENLTTAMENMQNPLQILADANAATDLHLLGGQDVVIERLMQKKAYTETEIAGAATETERDLMINFNLAVEKQKELTSDLRAAASDVQSTMIAAQKVSYKGYTDVLKGANLGKKEEIVTLVRDFKDYDGSTDTSSAGVQALDKLKSVSEDLQKVTASLNERRANIAKDKRKELAQSEDKSKK